MATASNSLVSMKRPAPKKAEGANAMAEPGMPGRDEYGWGLQLRLENFELDKLKMGLPRVGAAMSITAKGTVVSVSESKSRGNEGDRAVQIQITDLAIGKGGGST